MLADLKTEHALELGTTVVVDSLDLQRLLDRLSAHGYNIIGPTVRDGAIVYDYLQSIEQLPIGLTDEQEAGTYRLKKRNDGAYFGYNLGPSSWKRFLHLPLLRLWQAGGEESLRPTQEEDPPRKMAFFGARSCELHAIAVQDKVFLGGPYIDQAYKARREQLFVVAVNCGHAGRTCFCASTGTGPRAQTGYDLALTEVLEDRLHYFVVDVGTQAGAGIVSEVPHRPAAESDISRAAEVVARVEGQMGRTLETTSLKELLYNNYDHPRWDQVAERCLTCGNCTLVCPTCFCTTVEDVTDLTGERAERWRKWDSCFTTDFSYIHGGSIRPSPRARYRQWMTHKLATWQDQFGTLGCVGCGRCITWCPVGIDITEEARAIRESAAADTPERRDGNANS